MSNPVKDEWRSDDGSVRLILGDYLEIAKWDASFVTNAVAGCVSCLTARNGVTDAENTNGISRTAGATEKIRLAVVTDPPYGKQLYATDTNVMSPEMLHHLVDLGNACAIFGWPEQLVGLLIDAGIKPVEWITWAPTNGMLRGFNLHGLWRVQEVIAIFGDCRFSELRIERSAFAKWVATKWIKPGRRARCPNRIDDRVLDDTSRCPDVWFDPSPGLAFHANKRNHPNEKPVSLMERLVAGVGCQVIFDPFMGSGTTGIACRRLGCSFLGIEIDTTHWQRAVQRLETEMSRFPLFEPPKPKQLELLDAGVSADHKG